MRKGRGEHSEADTVFVCGDDCGSFNRAGGAEDAVQIVLDVAVMIGKGGAGGEVETGGLETGKKLIGPSDAAKCRNRAIEGGYFHVPV